MKINELLLIEFKNQETKYYDEGVLESKIIKLESELLKSVDDKKVYEEIKKCYQRLSEMIDLRLIDFVINKIQK